MDELSEYENELDPPTMLEFDLLMCLATLVDMWDCTEAWSDIEIEGVLDKASALVNEATPKYLELMEEYSKRKTLDE